MLDINKFSNKFMFSRFFHLMSDITSDCRVVKHYQSQDKDKDKDEDDKDKDKDRERERERERKTETKREREVSHSGK